jgi:hypothetical protein
LNVSQEEVKKYVEIAQNLLKETVQNNKEESKTILSDFKSNNNDISQLLKVMHGHHWYSFLRKVKILLKT